MFKLNDLVGRLLAFAIINLFLCCWLSFAVHLLIFYNKHSNELRIYMVFIKEIQQHV